MDPLAKDLAQEVKWIPLKGISSKTDNYPVVITGQGNPLLLLHGFDSSFLEFRRLVPLLKKNHLLIIPDLYGFGFCPRPVDVDFGPEAIFQHLRELLERVIPFSRPVGLIGASMGGAVAMELGRRYPERIQRLLLLAPAGLTGKPMPLPPGLDQLGVWFLSRPFVRRSLCRQAFSDPDLSVGEKEEQIASLHLSVPGWGRSLSSFARSGGMANCGSPLPDKAINVIFGKNDRILSSTIKKQVHKLLDPNVEELKDCGHLPHLDCPEFVARRWLEFSRSV
nr:alpha/beta hydrolase [Prochlorococcus sp. MIT 1341]